MKAILKKKTLLSKCRTNRTIHYPMTNHLKPAAIARAMIAVTSIIIKMKYKKCSQWRGRMPRRRKSRGSKSRRWFIRVKRR